MSYTEFISQFPITYKNTRGCEEGFHYHHIIPKSEQTEQDSRVIKLTPAEHFWAHILYDQEHGTHTSLRFRNNSNLNPLSYEECLPYNDIDSEIRKKIADARRGDLHSPETKKKMQESLSGKAGRAKGTLINSVKKEERYLSEYLSRRASKPKGLSRGTREYFKKHQADIDNHKWSKLIPATIKLEKMNNPAYLELTQSVRKKIVSLRKRNQ